MRLICLHTLLRRDHPWWALSWCCLAALEFVGAGVTAESPADFWHSLSAVLLGPLAVMSCSLGWLVFSERTSLFMAAVTFKTSDFTSSASALLSITAVTPLMLRFDDPVRPCSPSGVLSCLP